MDVQKNVLISPGFPGDGKSESRLESPYQGMPNTSELRIFSSKPRLYTSNGVHRICEKDQNLST